jgi:hypothetical protein
MFVKHFYSNLSHELQAKLVSYCNTLVGLRAFHIRVYKPPTAIFSAILNYDPKLCYLLFTNLACCSNLFGMHHAER